ncbi:protein-L-isoaspartate(D-aspartate) O-methyltransferase [Novosphingobium malaysiense]|uniref:Protein-L-isoaspartate O-methyltransferase n=1 Tax=Novosphingobium malaysiense TaxID=1348853 RepID=A0A0B1ZVR1_9SPHN|nr:protein-L-isoaspartate(D-aspartate) O-methyltransferase [Novosphingobium malaysiense]KHK93539.1 protein-L-isoaspartate O-methyltransferase [Novosphingobium malaysiense]
MKPLTEDHLAIYRRHMVEVIDIHFDLLSDELGKPHMGERLREALLKVPRHVFVPRELILASYQDGPLPIGFDKTISQPFIAALMIDLLDVQPDDSVLEVGTGYGYQAALLAELSRHVASIDVVEEFIEMAESRLMTLGYEDVDLRVGDGSRGWPEKAPFDKILVTAAEEEIPAPLAEQLKAGGRLVMPLGPSDTQQITLVEKNDDGTLAKTPIMPARFTPLETV